MSRFGFIKGLMRPFSVLFSTKNRYAWVDDITPSSINKEAWELTNQTLCKTMSDLAPTIDTKDWLDKHNGHNIVEETRQVSIKLMYWKVCKDCKDKHLYKIEQPIKK